MRKRFITFVITLLSIFLITSCCQNSEFIRPELSEPTPAASFYADNLSVDSSDKLSVHFIDVGQADCALLSTKGHYMVIDGGNNGDADTILSYLEGQGVEKLDAVVGTHPHEDHIGSLDAIINHFDVDAVYMPKIMHTSKTFEDVLDAVANKGLKIKSPSPGDTIDFNGLEIEVLGPQREYKDFNNNSIVLKVNAGETAFLFTGDAEETAEKDILQAGYDLQADVLKVGHHGSSTSSSQAFLQAVKPKYAVISVGVGNSDHYRRRTGSLKRWQMRFHRIRHCNCLCQGGREPGADRKKRTEADRCQGGAGAAVRREGAGYAGGCQRRRRQCSSGSKRGEAGHGRFRKNRCPHQQCPGIRIRRDAGGSHPGAV